MDGRESEERRVPDAADLMGRGKRQRRDGGKSDGSGCGHRSCRMGCRGQCRGGQVLRAEMEALLVHDAEVYPVQGEEEGAEGEEKAGFCRVQQRGRCRGPGSC